MSAALAKTTRRSSAPTLDAATLQGVLDLRSALRELKRLERADLASLSPVRRGLHARSLESARWNVRETRLGLERLLEEDL